MHYHDRRRDRLFLQRTLILILVVGLAYPPSLSAQSAPAQHAKVTVTVATANVRSQPSPSGKLVTQVKSGETLDVLEDVGEWYHVQLSDGKDGYLYKELAAPVPVAAPPANPAEAPAPPPSADAQGVTIDHKPIGCVMADQFPKVDTCLLPASNVGRAQIHFRAQPTDPWYAVDLNREGPCFSAYLPKPLKTTVQVDYYVDVVDRGMNETEDPGQAPSEPFHMRVVKSQNDCESRSLIAAAFKKVAQAVVVTVARDAGGQALGTEAIAMMESHFLLAGFSAQGVLVGATGVAPVSAAAGAAGGGSGATGGVSTAGATGGSALTTPLLVGGGLAAVGLGVAVAAGGSSSSGSCSASSLAASAGGNAVAVGNDTICSVFLPCGSQSFRACVNGVCTQQNCGTYYQLSNGAQFACASNACLTTPDTSSCGGAAQAAVNACGSVNPKGHLGEAPRR